MSRTSANYQSLAQSSDQTKLGHYLPPGAPLKFDDPRQRWSEDLTARRQHLVDELSFLRQGTGRTVSQAALHFVLCHEAVSTAIPGTTSIRHLEENAAAAGGTLSEDEMKRLRGLLDGEFASLNLGW